MKWLLLTAAVWAATFAIIQGALATGFLAATGSGNNGFYLKEDGFFYLQEDGTSKYVLEP